MTDDPSTPSVAAEVGRRLRAARLARGEKQVVTAMRLGVDVATYSRWERGIHLPRPDLLPRVLDYFGLSAAELGLPDSAPRVARSQAVVTGPAATRAAEVDNVKRREFLEGVGGLVGATASLDWDRLASLLDSRRRIDERMVEDLLAVTRGYAVQCVGDVAPSTLLPLVERHLTHLQTYLIAVPGRPAVTRRLCSVTSETATVAGWLSAQLQNHGDARRHYRLARDLAREAEDGPRLAFALGRSSDLYSPISGGEDAPRAVALLQEADAAAGTQAPAHLRSWLSARLAEEHALRGQAHHAERELERAAQSLGSATSTGPGYFACCNPAWLSGYRGHCSLLTGQDAKASAILEETLTSELRATSQRSAVMTDLGVAYAHQGEIERSCALIGDAVEMAAQTTLSEFVGRAVRARREHLAGYADAPPVRQLDERLRAAVA